MGRGCSAAAADRPTAPELASGFFVEPTLFGNVGNGMRLAREEVFGPMAPCSGFTAGGLGRENGLEALREYTELKTVWIELTGATRDPFSLA